MLYIFHCNNLFNAKQGLLFDSKFKLCTLLHCVYLIQYHNKNPSLQSDIRLQRNILLTKVEMGRYHFVIWIVITVYRFAVTLHSQHA